MSRSVGGWTGLGSGASLPNAAGAQGGEQAEKEGEHDRVEHDATGRLPPLRIPELTDGKTAFPDGELANHSYWLIRLLR